MEKKNNNYDFRDRLLRKDPSEWFCWWGLGVVPLRSPGAFSVVLSLGCSIRVWGPKHLFSINSHKWLHPYWEHMGRTEDGRAGAHSAWLTTPLWVCTDTVHTQPWCKYNDASLIANQLFFFFSFFLIRACLCACVVLGVTGWVCATGGVRAGQLGGSRVIERAWVYKA